MRRFGWRQTWTWTLMMSMLASAAPIWAEDDDGPAGEQLLPKEVLIFVSIPSVPELRQRTDESLFGAMLKDPEFQPAIEKIKAKLDEKAEEIKEELGVTLDDLLELPQGEITFALVELPPRKLALVLLLDYGDRQSTIETLLDKMEAALKESGGEVEGEDVDGVNLRTFTFESEEDENPFNKLAYFNHESYLALASDPEALKAVLERWDGKSDDTFAQHEEFEYILDKCSTDGREPLIKWYANPIGLTQAVVGMLQAQVPQAGLAMTFLPLLGLNNLKGIGGGGDIGVDDFDSVYKMFVYVDQPTTGVLEMFRFPATDLSPPPWVPADVAGYSAMNWNSAGAYSAMEKLVDSFQGPGALGKQLDQLAKNDPGIHLKKDIIDQMTGQIHILVGEAEEAAETPKMMFAVDVKDDVKMNAVLVKAAKSEHFEGKTRDFEGVTVYEVQNEDEGPGASIAVADKHLLISTDTTMLENALRPRSEAPALMNDPAYKSLAKHFPKKLSILNYQNGSSQMQAVYQMIKSGSIPDMPHELRDIVDALPDYDALKKYLRASGGYVIPDAKGGLSVTFTLKEEK